MSTDTPRESGRQRAKYILSVDHIEQLSEVEKQRLSAVGKKYAFRASDYYLSLIDWNDPDDPIRRLVIPHPSELNE